MSQCYRRVGRAHADIGTLTPALAGAAYLLVADRKSHPRPEAEATAKIATTVLARVTQGPPS